MAGFRRQLPTSAFRLPTSDFLELLPFSPGYTCTRFCPRWKNSCGPRAHRPGTGGQMAVLPAAATWRGSGGPAATLVSPGDGTLTVHRHADPPAKLVLRFFSADQVNRTFLNQKALPPLPTGGFWRVGKGRERSPSSPEELDTILQPAPGVLDDATFSGSAIVRLVVPGAHRGHPRAGGARSRVSPHALAYTLAAPHGFEMPALGAFRLGIAGRRAA